MFNNDEKINMRDIYESLWRCRDFELSHLWQRSVFLSAFLLLCFTGYGMLFIAAFIEPERDAPRERRIEQEKISKVEKSSVVLGQYPYEALHFSFDETNARAQSGAVAENADPSARRRLAHVAATVIALMGVWLSSMWIMMGKGSKRWYERYEQALYRIERDPRFSKIAGRNDDQAMLGAPYIHGNLPEAPHVDDGLFSNAAGRYSSSKINIGIGQISLLFWGAVLVVHSLFFLFADCVKSLPSCVCNCVFVVIVAAILILVSIFVEKFFNFKSSDAVPPRVSVIIFIPGDVLKDINWEDIKNGSSENELIKYVSEMKKSSDTEIILIVDGNEANKKIVEVRLEELNIKGENIRLADPSPNEDSAYAQGVEIARGEWISLCNAKNGCPSKKFLKKNGKKMSCADLIEERSGSKENNPQGEKLRFKFQDNSSKSVALEIVGGGSASSTSSVSAKIIRKRIFDRADAVNSVPAHAYDEQQRIKERATFIRENKDILTVKK